MPVYCSSCILPDTRPGVRLDEEGICNGCRNAAHKAEIDWATRADAFNKLIAAAKTRGAAYDCVIPASGGKDSHWQVVTCLEHGLHPLCVTYVYPGRTELGERNLRNLAELGVDHIELRVNPRVERDFVEKAFRRKGISGLVSHMGIFTFPINLAVRFDIPLVIYGENSAFEYGTEDESLIGANLDRRWIESFGVTDNTQARDWIDNDLSENDLAMFFLPEDELLEAKRIRTVFLGWYFPWDPENTYRIAREHGFEARTEGARVGHLDYVNIDDEFIAIHHHAKWYKYGITRSWDTLSIEIRAGRLSRADAVDQLRQTGDETPWDDIRLFCEYLGIGMAEYFKVLESFRNEAIWSRRDGRWTINGFLLDDYEWPADPGP